LQLAGNQPAVGELRWGQLAEVRPGADDEPASGIVAPCRDDAWAVVAQHLRVEGEIDRIRPVQPLRQPGDYLARIDADLAGTPQSRAKPLLHDGRESLADARRRQQLAWPAGGGRLGYELAQNLGLIIVIRQVQRAAPQ